MNETIQIMCSQMAVINFNRTDKTREEFDAMDWAEQSRFIEIYADVTSTEVNDWIFIKGTNE